MKFLLFLFLFLALILESSITSLPLIFIILLVFTLIYKENYMFLIAFILGIIFDILSLRSLGLSSIFLSVTLFLVLIYQNKFEIATNNFVLISSFLGSLAFLIFLGFSNWIFLQAIFSSLIALLIFVFIKRFDKSSFQKLKNI